MNVDFGEEDETVPIIKDKFIRYNMKINMGGPILQNCKNPEKWRKLLLLVF